MYHNIGNCGVWAPRLISPGAALRGISFPLRVWRWYGRAVPRPGRCYWPFGPGWQTPPDLARRSVRGNAPEWGTCLPDLMWSALCVCVGLICDLFRFVIPSRLARLLCPLAVRTGALFQGSPLHLCKRSGLWVQREPFHTPVRTKLRLSHLCSLQNLCMPNFCRINRAIGAGRLALTSTRFGLGSVFASQSSRRL